MKCPVDGATLVMTERSGVEIDYCPQCRGVWLDRGELDKIVEKAAPPVALREPEAAPRREEPRPAYREEPRAAYGDRPRHDDDRRRYDDDDDYRKKKRRKGFLDDLFDF